MKRTVVCLAMLTGLFGQDLSGTWCSVTNQTDCVTIRQANESVQASFVYGGRPQSEGVGWTRNGRVAVGFRRLDNSDIGTWNAELDGSGRLASRTINPNGSVRWTGAYARPGDSSTGNIDPTGTWRHSPDGTWTITSVGGGRYQAQESGLGYASGTAYFTNNGTFRIDYSTRDGSITGYYEMRFSDDGRSASGTVRELTGPKRSGPSNWTRVTGGSGGSVTSNIDPTGTWRHSPDGTWAITSVGGGRYQAQESGLGYASGPAYFTNNGVFRIDYTTRDGSVNGYYEMRFSADGRSASGTFREVTGTRHSGPSNWTRVSGGGSVAAQGEPWLPGSFDWVSGQFLVVHPQNRITVYLNGSKINEGRWDYLGNRRFRFTHEKGGYVDTVELSADDRYLTGRNNQGAELRGVRRTTSPRQ